MKCPRCGDEYEDSYTRCSDCDVDLVPDDYESQREDFESPCSQSPMILEHCVEHIEALGLQVRREEDKTEIVLNASESIQLNEFGGGIIFEIWYTPNTLASENRLEYLELINRFNCDVPLLRISHNEEHKNLIMDAWYPGGDNPKSFENFLQQFVNDRNTVTQSTDFLKFFE